MPMYNLIEYSDAYLKTSGGLWQYYRDESALNANGEIFDCNLNMENITDADYIMQKDFVKTLK